MFSSKRSWGLCAGAALAIACSIAAPFTTPAASATVFVTEVIQLGTPAFPNPKPGAVAVDPGSHQAFVADAVRNAVLVIDTDTRKVTTTIELPGRAPRGVAVDPARHAAYVTNYMSGTVSVIDTTTNTVTAEIAHDTIKGIGTNPAGIGLDSELDRAYVGNLTEGTVSVIDTNSNTVVAVLPHDSKNGIGSRPRAIAVDTALHRAFVTNLGESTVSVIDTATDRVIAVIPHDSISGIGNTPIQVAVDSGSHRAFVTNYGDSTVSVIDTARNSVTALLPHDDANGIGTGPDTVAVDQTSRQAYVASDRQITAINTDTLTVTRIVRQGSTVDFGDDVTGLAMDSAHHQALAVGTATGTVAVLDLDATAPLARRGGLDRYEVSARNSAAEFDPGIPVAYVASGAGFADALSASAAAGSRGAPVVLTARDSLPPATAAELLRLKPKRVIVLGGTDSVSDAVVRDLGTFAPTVDRLGGADRYAVSAAVSRDNFPAGVPVAYLASGAVFPDALSGSAVAANNGGPVLLTAKDTIPQSTLDELSRLKPGRIVLLGGTNTVSPSVENQLKASIPTTRVGGADRYEVSANASAGNFSAANVVYIASGAVFPDALSGSPAAAANGAPVLLVTRDAIPPSVASELTRLKPAQIVVLGGPSTIGDTVYQQLRDFVR